MQPRYGHHRTNEWALPMRTTTQDKPKDRGGARPGNKNARRHGLRTWFATGRLAECDSQQRKRVAALEGKLYSDLMAEFGQITLGQQLAITAILRAEGGVLLASKAVATQADMPPAEKRQHQLDIKGFTETQLRAFERLGLPTQPGSNGRKSGEGLTSLPPLPESAFQDDEAHEVTNAA